MYTPSLVCGLAICCTDMRRRRVPRRWIVVTIMLQTVLFTVLACLTSDFAPLWRAFALMLAGMGIQLCIALLAPKRCLGFGDVTTSALACLTVGHVGFTAFLFWWLLTGLIGMAWMAVWMLCGRLFQHRARGRSDTRVPFVPVLVASGILAVLCTP